MDDTNKIVPSSVAIIMDGNRRWAKQRNLPGKMGHREGANTVRKICTAAHEIGIKYLTLYAFSTENWKREKDEVDEIMNLLREFLNECIEKIGKENHRITFIGDKSKLDSDIVEKMLLLEKETNDNTGLTVAVAVNYGGRDEIFRAVKKCFAENKDLSIDDFKNLKEEEFEKFLDTDEKRIPDPELIIRTSGEMRISNFLIWQCAYSEFYFSEKNWPDFDKSELELAIDSFSKRNRRFGGK